MKRPDLSNADQELVEYIKFLERRLGINIPRELPPHEVDTEIPAEPKTAFCLISISLEGYSKRTYRYLYTLQHRGGTGVFNLDVPQPDAPAVLGVADENQNILLLTTHARVFRYPVRNFPLADVHDRGVLAFDRMGLEPGESVAAILPLQAKGYIALLGKSGKVRLLRHHLFGEYLKPGTVLFNPQEFGSLTSACWTPGDADLLIATSSGMAIRFSEKVIAPQGDWGIRLGTDDSAVGITSVNDDSIVLIVTADGRGTLRQMTNFAANKSPGGSGKIAIKNNKVVGVQAVSLEDDVFITTRYGKVIRFKAGEIPITDGPVQGVNLIMLRSDEVTAFTCDGGIK